MYARDGNNGNSSIPPPINMAFNGPEPGSLSVSNSKSGSNPQHGSLSKPVTPISTQFNIKPKGARHRKGSSKIDFVPTRKLPPAPPSKQLPTPSQQQQHKKHNQQSLYPQQHVAHTPPPPQYLQHGPPQLAQSQPQGHNYSPGQEYGSNGM